MTSPASNKKPQEPAKKKDFGERLSDADAILKTLPAAAQKGPADKRKEYMSASYGGNPAKMRMAMEAYEKSVNDAKASQPERKPHH